MKQLTISKEVARVLLEYIAMEDCLAKRNMEILCKQEINSYFEEIDKYCKIKSLTQEQFLINIIEN